MRASEFSKNFSACPYEADFAVRIFPHLSGANQDAPSAIDPQGAVRKSGKGLLQYRMDRDRRFQIMPSLGLDIFRIRVTFRQALDLHWTFSLV